MADETRNANTCNMLRIPDGRFCCGAPRWSKIYDGKFVFGLDRSRTLTKFIIDDPERSEAQPGNPEAASLGRIEIDRP
jgi:hypothetical protein